MSDNKKEEKNIGFVGWVVFLIFIAILAIAVYNKMTIGN